MSAPLTVFVAVKFKGHLIKIDLLLFGSVENDLIPQGHTEMLIYSM